MNTGHPLPADREHLVRMGISGMGTPLEPRMRRRFESMLGRDLAEVRIHTGAEAAAASRAIGAKAYTVGTDIALAYEEPASATEAGRGLFAHELAHVVQQRASGVPVVSRLDIGDIAGLVGGSPAVLAAQAIGISGTDVLEAGGRFILGDRLWSLLRAFVIGFEDGLTTAPEDQRRRIQERFDDIGIGDAYELSNGFSVGVLLGLWNGLVRLVKTVVTLLELPANIVRFFGSLPQLAARYAPRIQRLVQSADELATRFRREFARNPAAVLAQVERLMEAGGQAILGMVRAAGRSAAGRLLALVDQPWFRIGRDVGDVTGQVLFEVLLAIATDLIGSIAEEAASLATRIAGGALDALRAVGRLLGEVIDWIGRALQRAAGAVGELLESLRALLSDVRLLVSDVAPEAEMAAAETRASERIRLMHGTTREGFLELGGLEEGRINVSHASGAHQDLGQGFYMTTDEATAAEYGRVRNLQRHGPGGGPSTRVLAHDVRVEDLGNVVDIRRGGNFRAAWERFLDHPPSELPAGMRPPPGMATRRAYLAGLGSERRGVAFEEFLRSIHMERADTIVAPLGDGVFGGITAGQETTQVCIRSQTVADRLNAIMRGTP